MKYDNEFSVDVLLGFLQQLMGELERYPRLRGLIYQDFTDRYLWVNGVGVGKSVPYVSVLDRNFKRKWGSEGVGDSFLSEEEDGRYYSPLLGVCIDWRYGHLSKVDVDLELKSRGTGFYNSLLSGSRVTLVQSPRVGWPGRDGGELGFHLRVSAGVHRPSGVSGLLCVNDPGSVGRFNEVLNRVDDYWGRHEWSCRTSRHPPKWAQSGANSQVNDE